MRQVEFHTLLHGGQTQGHRVFIATMPGQSQLLGDATTRLLVRVNLNGVVFDAEGWPSDGHHVIEVPQEIVASARLKGGDPARVALHIMGP
ncbi:MAG TPA: hypothetical protein VM370_04260 [Candidatus Thermoplasmatota archaeon]|nr:hypothetical protein [Candidatus Thermoplasmatota archaeon]